jgi:hypothetical protein
MVRTRMRVWVVCRYAEAERFFDEAMQAVEGLDAVEYGEKLMLAARMHRTHTRDVKKHKAHLARWERMLEERQHCECEASLLASR